MYKKRDSSPCFGEPLRTIPSIRKVPEMSIKQIFSCIAMPCAALMIASSIGCSAADDTVVEPSRETRVQYIANEACKRFDECGNIGEGDGNTYPNMDECRSDMENKFYDLWPANECSDGRIDQAAYDNCVDRAQVYSCDDNLFEFISYYNECNADDVCTDPAQ